jgi:putative oxidoreductase
MKSDDLGKLILRLTLGILILLHGLFKISYGVSGVSIMLASQGLPTFMAYGVLIGEVVAPILIILGLFTRLGGWLIAVNMLFAFFLAHLSQLTSLATGGGWSLELQGMFLFTAVALGLMGAGRFSVGGVGGKFN